MNFISVKGPELYSKYVGESEQAVATVFRRARLSSPCVIFFDEIDALAVDADAKCDVGCSGRKQRSNRACGQPVPHRAGRNSFTQASRNRSPQSPKVLVIAATNRPDMLDPALLRPGRLDTHIFLGLPDREAREKILQVHLNRVPRAADLDIGAIADKTEGYSGAELAAICSEACMKTLNDNIDAKEVDQEHLLQGLSAVKARTSPELLQVYIQFSEQRSKE